VTDAPLTGGCQCGAVRFAVTGEVRAGAICHCRMCQKAFGAFYAPLVVVGAVTWTKGAPTHFRSSNIARRGFCRDCGTPLSYEPDVGDIELAIGAFDEPAKVRPRIQVGLESRIPWLSDLDSLPTLEAEADEPARPAVRSFQHPDRDD